MLNSNFANRRNKISPIVGTKSRQSSEKFFANRRKTIVIFIFWCIKRKTSQAAQAIRGVAYRFAWLVFCAFSGVIPKRNPPSRRQGV
jgi:hypothetical protein